MKALVGEMKWIGVDLDGTLAYDDGIHRGPNYIGDPISPMVSRVKTWLAQGKDVRIFTARAAHGSNYIKPIEDWCKKHIGQILPVTSCKDMHMVEIWDDRAVQVVKNTGIPIQNIR